jgi:hypothetical protein
MVTATIVCFVVVKVKKRRRKKGKGDPEQTDGKKMICTLERDRAVS